MLKNKKHIIKLLLILLVSYFVLMIPDFQNKTIIKMNAAPFAWNNDAAWQILENNFTAAKKLHSNEVDSTIQLLFIKEEQLLKTIASDKLNPSNSSLDELLDNYFKLASLIAARPLQRDHLLVVNNQIRNQIKLQSRQWNMNDRVSRNSLYKILYGIRAATEEVLLQTATIPFDPVMLVTDEPSSAPFTKLFNIKVHSGDLLLSRGGAEVSALISRGNNYPGNFSHVALIYVDEKTNIPYLIEAHIEKGVAISSAQQYISDKKLRFMVLRPSAGLQAIKQKLMLPHLAAKYAFEQLQKRHIPYDFKMNFNDTSAMFCSEVGSYAYKQMGIQLWKTSSVISSQGVVNWLSAFGVENFVTKMPADLEYDNQLAVVAEWRNPETLLKDHIDNAVMDALLEKADGGMQIRYNSWQLPFVRLVKVYCKIKNAFGKTGLIPEGMSATQALKNQEFVSLYKVVKWKTEFLIEQFIKQKHYNPPYWQMVKLAKGAAAELKT